MCSEYRNWINGLRVMSTNLDRDYKITADRHISSCETCLYRMEKGVELLIQNETIRTAFQYMNLAMLMQQLHYNLPLQLWEDDGKGSIKLSNPAQMPDVWNRETWGENKERYGKWRPFQLLYFSKRSFSFILTA